MAEKQTKDPLAEGDQPQPGGMLFDPLFAAALLLDGVAHKLNNILGTIVGSADMLSDEIRPDSPLREDVARILAAGEQARIFMRRIGAFGQGHQQRPGPAEMGRLTANALAAAVRNLPLKVTASLASTKKNLPVLLSPAEAYLLMRIFLENAAAAMRGDGSIEVRLSHWPEDGQPGPPPASRLAQQEQAARLSFRDRGECLAPESLRQAFDPFCPDPPRNSNLLALYAAQHFVKKLGGEISVENTSEQQGVAFHVFLPLADQKPFPTLNRDTLSPTPGNTILLVEDEEIMGKVLRRLLNSLGHEVIFEQDALAALATFRRDPGRFHLVMTDFFLPQLSGLELIHALRVLRPDIPVLLCSGSSSALPEDVLRLDNAALLYKPVGQAELAQSLQRLLADSSARG